MDWIFDRLPQLLGAEYSRIIVGHLKWLLRTNSGPALST